MVCPEPEVLSSFVDGVIADEARVVVAGHLDECDECRGTVAILARAAVADRSQASQATGLPARSMLGSPTPGRPAFTPDVMTAGTPTPVDVDGATALAETLAAPGQPLPELAPGATVGRYVIREVIGKGGMGIVYAAEDPELGREIALKLLRADFARDQPDAAGRIVREAQTMARIDHPNVVTVHDVGRVGDQVFIAMERVRGTSLRGWLTRTPRAIGDVVDVFVAAGRGLIAAHDAGIVHRDFKPDNVLVGDDGRVRVTDFGIAIERADAAGGPKVSAGTPAYMAPEQHAGGNVDPRTDQFGFCVALYEALYGAKPFPGSSRRELADAVKAGRLAPPPAGARVPRSLRDILVRGLAATPGDRFPTLDELLRALGRDRGRRPRQVAYVSAAVLISVVVALTADFVARTRAATIAKISFAAARSQLARMIDLRTEAFTALSDLVNNRDALDEVVATRDQADFGLGTTTDDADTVARIHDNLRSADWVEFVGGADHFGIADAKGRLLYTSVDDTAFGRDVLAVDAIGAAYRSSPRVSVGVVRGDDPDVVGAGLLGRDAHGLYVVFARTRAVADRPRAVFVQLVEAPRLLGEVSLGQGILLSLAVDNTAEGAVPPAIVAGARSIAIGAVAELESDGDAWLVQRHPVIDPSSGATIASLVLAHRTDAGITGLFPHARTILGGFALLLAVCTVLGLAIAHRRDRSRSRVSVA